MERTQVIIDGNKRAITIRTATGTFTQSGVSKPIIDLIDNLEKYIAELKKRDKTRNVLEHCYQDLNKIPEKLEDYFLDEKGKYPIELTLYEEILRDKINEIIEYLNSKGDE